MRWVNPPAGPMPRRATVLLDRVPFTAAGEVVRRPLSAGTGLLTSVNATSGRLAGPSD